MSNEELTKVLLDKMEIVITQGRDNSIQLATMHGKLEEKDKNCDRQNERLEAVFIRTDKLDDRITAVETAQAGMTSGQAVQNKTDSNIIQWVAILIAGLAGMAGWFKH